MKKIMTRLFVSVCRRLEGTYITRFRPIGFLYKKVFYMLKPAKISLEIVGNNKMYLDLSDTTSMRMYMFDLDRLIIDFIEANLKPGSVFVDIGAHVGYYTLRAAGLVGTKGRVYAFEPEPRNNELLRKNVKINNYSNVNIIDKCVSSKNGSIDLFIKGDSGTHSTKLKSGKKIKSRATTLDKFCADNRINRVDMIKIDVEGGETDAFSGMQKIVRKSRNVKLIAEFVPSYIKNSGSTPKLFLDKLSSMGFKKFYIITEKAITPASKEEIQNLKEDIYNVLVEK